MNDNKNPNDNVLALPEPQPDSFMVKIPNDVFGLVLIGTRPDGSLFLNTENDSLGDVALLLDLAKAEVLRMATPPDDGEDGAPPQAAG